MPILEADIDHLMNQAKVKLPGASEAGIRGELYDTLQEFYNDSSVWVEAIPFTTTGTSQDYAVKPTAGQIIRLAGVLDSNNLPVPADMPVFGTIHLAQTYSQAVSMFAYVVLNTVHPKEHKDFPPGPDFILSIYGVTILDGLLGRMMGQKAKTYSDEQLSVYHTKRFRDGTSMARVAALRRNTFGTQSWRYPTQFRTTNQRSGVSVGTQTGFGL